MADIVERLINYRPENEWGDSVHHTICTEAAGEIKSLKANLAAKETEALGYLRAVGTLQAEVRKLAKALEKCVDALSRCYDVCDWPADGRTVQDEAIRAARAALDQDKVGGE